MKSKYVVVDLETTGNNPKNGDRIIQIAAIVIEQGKIIDQYSSYINPERLIPPFIQELTGIKNTDVENAPTFKELAPYIIGILDEAVFVAHNVLFDLTFLQAELERVGYERFLGDTVDTVELAKIINPQVSSFRLEDLGRFYGFLHERPHQADSDAYVTSLLFIEFYKQLKRLPKPTIKSLYRLSFLLKSEIKELLAEILQEYSTVSEPWRPDLDIYRGLAILKQEYNLQPIHPQGLKSQYPLNDYGFLPYLKQAFKSHKVSLIEDGVKDPIARFKAIYEFACENHISFTIGVHSKDAAEQLMECFRCNQMIMDLDNQVSILHSKEQYLSLPKFEQSMREKQQNYESTIAKMQILVWLTTTKTGCLEELNLSSGGREFWNEISHHTNLHPRLFKPWTERDFYSRQQSAAKQAKIIITTHNSLISDLEKDDFLSRSQYIVLEDANQFPTSVQNGLTKEMSYVKLRNLLNKIGTMENRQLLRAVMTLLKEKTDSSGYEKEIIVLLEGIASKIECFFQTLFTYGVTNNKDMNGPKVECRLEFTGDENRQIKNTLLMEKNELYEMLGNLYDHFRIILATFNQIPIEKLKRSQFNIIDELTKLTEEINEFRLDVYRFFKDSSSNHEVWMSWNVKGHRNSIQIYAKPLSVSKWILQHIIQASQHSLFISDAMTVGESFEYMSQKLGVHAVKANKLVIPAPKDCYLTVLTLLNGSSFDSINDFVQEQKKQVILLFHSQVSMKKIYNDMKGLSVYQNMQLQALGLSSGSAIKLLRNHLAFPQSILFMTYTGWEQVRHAYDGSSTIIMIEPPVQMNGMTTDDERLSELVIQLRNQLHAFPDYDNKGKWILMDNDLIKRRKEEFITGLNDVKTIFKYM